MTADAQASKVHCRILRDTKIQGPEPKIDGWDTIKSTSTTIEWTTRVQETMHEKFDLNVGFS